MGVTYFFLGRVYFGGHMIFHRQTQPQRQQDVGDQQPGVAQPQVQNQDNGGAGAGNAFIYYHILTSL